MVKFACLKSVRKMRVEWSGNVKSHNTFYGLNNIYVDPIKEVEISDGFIWFWGAESFELC